MDRLTNNDNSSTEYAWKQAHYDVYELNGILNERLAEYESLDEQGRLLRLPCEVGATVYLIVNDRIEERVADMTWLGILWEDYRTKWFTNKKEVEKALKERK